MDLDCFYNTFSKCVVSTRQVRKLTHLTLFFKKKKKKSFCYGYKRLKIIMSLCLGQSINGYHDPFT
jgi:hypothetical protein